MAQPTFNDLGTYSCFLPTNFYGPELALLKKAVGMAENSRRLCLDDRPDHALRGMGRRRAMRLCIDRFFPSSCEVFGGEVVRHQAAQGRRNMQPRRIPCIAFPVATSCQPESRLAFP